jgi:hypothetical protein
LKTRDQSDRVSTNLGEVKPASNILRVESETTDQGKSTVNALSDELKVNSQPEMGGRFQLPRRETGEERNTGSINSVEVSEELATPSVQMKVSQGLR